MRRVTLATLLGFFVLGALLFSGASTASLSGSETVCAFLPLETLEDFWLSQGGNVVKGTPGDDILIARQVPT